MENAWCIHNSNVHCDSWLRKQSMSTNTCRKKKLLVEVYDEMKLLYSDVWVSHDEFCQ